MREGKFDWHKKAYQKRERSELPNFLINSPCGTGKTWLQSAMVARDIQRADWLWKGVVLTPQNTITQNFAGIPKRDAEGNLVVNQWGEPEVDPIPLKVGRSSISWLPYYKLHSTGFGRYCLKGMKKTKAHALIGQLGLPITEDRARAARRARRVDRNVILSTYQSLARAMGKVATAEARAELFRRKTFVIDESHHVGKDVNLMGDLVSEILYVQDMLKGHSDCPRLIFGTATPFRHDGVEILSDRSTFDEYTRYWHEAFEVMDLEEVFFSYPEYDGKKDLFEQIVACILREIHEHHLVVLPSCGTKWRRKESEGGKRDALELIRAIRKACPGLKVVDRVVEKKESHHGANVVVARSEFVEGTDWVPCSRIHNTSPEGSTTQAVQRNGRALRDSEGKRTVEIRYYLEKLPQELKRTDLSDHTNALLSCTVAYDLLSPVKVKLPKKKGSKKEVELKSLWDDEGQYHKAIRKVQEEVDALGEHKPKEKVLEAIDYVLDQVPPDGDREAAKQGLWHMVVRTVATKKRGRRALVSATSEIEALRTEEGIDLVWKKYGENGQSLYGMTEGSDHELCKRIRSALERSGEPPVKRVCEGCGGEFLALASEVRRGNAKYCTRGCVGGGTVKRTCPTCKGRFSPTRVEVERGGGKFCSPTCYQKRNGKNVRRACKVCKKVRYWMPSEIKQGKGSYCTEACWRRAQSKSKVVIKCRQCGKEKEVNRSLVNKGGGRYCSWPCWQEAKQRKEIWKVCGYCSVEFSADKPTRMFCSGSCRSRGMAAKRKKAASRS